VTAHAFFPGDNTGCSGCQSRASEGSRKCPRPTEERTAHHFCRPLCSRDWETAPPNDTTSWCSQDVSFRVPPALASHVLHLRYSIKTFPKGIEHDVESSRRSDPLRPLLRRPRRRAARKPSSRRVAQQSSSARNSRGTIAGHSDRHVKNSRTAGKAVEREDSQEVFSQTMCARLHVHVRASVPPGLRYDKVMAPRVSSERHSTPVTHFKGSRSVVAISSNPSAVL
jgi:hypothetical protein